MMHAEYDEASELQEAHGDTAASKRASSRRWARLLGVIVLVAGLFVMGQAYLVWQIHTVVTNHNTDIKTTRSNTVILKNGVISIEAFGKQITDQQKQILGILEADNAAVIAECHAIAVQVPTVVKCPTGPPK